MNPETETQGEGAGDEKLDREHALLNEPLARPASEQRIVAPDWLPSGPVARRFALHPARVSCLMGPYGSGKTTAGFFKGLICSMAVPPSPVDGVRYARGIIVRDTYRNLEQYTISSWHIKFKRNFGEWRGGSNGDPGKARILWRLPDDTLLDMEVLFAALGDHNVKQFCDGFEVTWAFLNGLDALPADMIRYMTSRTGRWPPPEHRPDNWREMMPLHKKIFADMNAPDEDNWTYTDFEEKPKKGWQLFKQPGGTEPDAENLANLDDDYYEVMVSDNANDPWFVDRFVHNKFGFSRSGEAVYKEYSDALHYAKAPIAFDPDRELLLGFDAGRDPRCVACQESFGGRLDVLATFVPHRRMGAETFGPLCSKWLTEMFAGATRIRAWADPAAANPTESTDRFWIDTVAAAMAIKIKAAPTNALEPRLSAVRQKLNGVADGMPMFRISPVKSNKTLRQGMQSKYRFGTEKVHGEEISTNLPVKNIFSHDQDALQYVALGSSDWNDLRGRKGRKKKTREETEYHPHAF